MLLNCGVEEDSWESLDGKEIKPVNPKRNQPWIFIGRTDLKLKLQYFGHLMQRAQLTAKDPMLGKSEGKRRRGDRGDGGTAALTQWTWVWANSGRWSRTQEAAVLQPMGSQRVWHDWMNNYHHHKAKKTGKKHYKEKMRRSRLSKSLRKTTTLQR